MKEIRLGKDTLIFSILTLITILTWIGFEVYRTATKSTIPEVTQKQMLPLDPKIKREILEGLKLKTVFSEEEINSLGGI